MSTASPLPLHELSESAAEASTGALRQQMAERLQQHRRRRTSDAARSQDAAKTQDAANTQAALPGFPPNASAGLTHRKSHRIANNVAARYAQSVSYRDFLQQESENAVRQAEAAAEVARRNAEAIAAAQQQLLDEIEQWNRRESNPALTPVEAGTAEVLTLTAHADGTVAAASVLAPSESLRSAAPSPLLPAAATTTVEAKPAIAAEPAAAARNTATAAFAQPRFSLPEAPAEPTTPLPTNLIEFPRQLVAARKARPRLAEGPLREDADAAPERSQLRIFEVEADAFSIVPTEAEASSLPEWSNLRLDSWAEPHETASPDAQVSLALPIYTAPVERRVMAAVVDACCIGTAFLLAVAAAAVAGDALPTGLLAAGAAGATLLLFGIGYMLLCFTLSGQTVGMRYARIALCTFGDDNPTRAAMRRRLLATGLSAVTLGLGFAWALLDDDKLGWHDRISRMYQRAY